jgi:hypothetical protein
MPAAADCLSPAFSFPPHANNHTQGFYVFIRALQLLRAHNQGVVLVGLGGASGSGKTAFSAKVR